jgi:hypothetical protein
LPDTSDPIIFLSYMREDLKIVRDLRDRLKRHKFNIWMDETKLLGGERWSNAVQLNISKAAHFLPCFSPNFDGRAESYMRREIAIASEEASHRLYVQYYIVPILLAGANIPDVNLTANAKARDLNVINFGADRRKAIELLVQTFKAAELAHSKRDPVISRNEDHAFDDPYRYETKSGGYTYRWDLVIAGREATISVSRKQSDAFFSPREHLLAARGPSFIYPDGSVGIRFESAKGPIQFILRVNSSRDGLVASFHDPILSREIRGEHLQSMSGSSAGAG